MKERLLRKSGREREREVGVGGNLTLCYNFSHADCICLLHFTIVPDSSGIPACLTMALPTQQHQTSVKVKKKTRGTLLKYVSLMKLELENGLGN